MEQQSLFVVFSSTPYKVGKAIRVLTRETYNHVSISLDESLTKMYSFSRRYCRTPFYGGFVRESVSRYHLKGSTAQIRVCRLQITAQQYEALEVHLAELFERKDRYLYNHLSASAALFHKPVKVRDAYTCVEFCVKILHSCGVDLDPNTYYSVGDLERLLHAFTVYTGPAPEADIYDAAFFARKPVTHPLVKTLRDFLRLFYRRLHT